MKKDAIKMLLDENNNDNIVLYDGNKAIEFEQICIVNLEKDYCILRPVNSLEDLEEDEGLVYRFEESPDGQIDLIYEEDEKIVDQVFEVYYKLLDDEISSK